MKKKMFIILLVSILFIPNIILASGKFTCDEKKYDPETETYHMTKSDPKMDIIKNEYNLLGFYDEDNYAIGEHKIDNELKSSVCKLFCREDVDYYFYGPKEVLAGRYFQYNIKGKVTINSLLTAQIIGTKQCTSVIDYNAWKEEYKDAQKEVVESWSDLKYWESYFLSDPDKNLTRNNVRNPEKYSATAYGTCESRNGCKKDPSHIPSKDYTYYVFEVKGEYGFGFNFIGNESNINNHSTSTYDVVDKEGLKLEPVMDCYGGTSGGCPCSACSPYEMRSLVIPEDINAKKDEIIGNYESAKATYINALSKRENVIIILYNCNLYDTINEGTDYRTTSNLGLGSSQSTYDFPVNSELIKRKISAQYPSVFGHCDEEKNDCTINYGDDKQHDKEYGSTPKLGIDIVSPSTKPTSYCSNLNYTADTQGGPCLQDSITSGNTTDNYVSYISCYGQFKTAACNSNTIRLKLPINSMATFKTSVTYDMWQKETYSVYSYTGVSQSPGVEIPGVSIMLDEKTYPVSLLTPIGKYKVELTYDQGFDRNIKRPTRGDINTLVNTYLVPEEDAKRFLSSSETGKTNYTCYILVDNETTLMPCEGDCCLDGTCDTPETCITDKTGACDPNNPSSPNGPNYELGFVFRTINLENIFPSSRKRGKNWNTKEAESVISSSKNKASTIWSSTPEYSYVLSASNRQNIRNYNRKKETENGNFEGVTNNVTFIAAGYLSNDLKCQVKNKEFVNCKSEFLKTGESQDFFQEVK